MIIKISFGIGLGALFVAASSDQVADRATVEGVVREQLREPASARFIDTKVRHPASGTSPLGAIACGKVAAKNGYGGMSGAVPFIYFIDAKRVYFARDEISLELDDLGYGAKLYRLYCEE